MDRRDSQSRGVALTTALVIAKAKSDSLQNIKNLNLWGNDLEDLKLIREMPSLQVLSLSLNKISSLKDFRYCLKLRQLFLRKNNIHDINEIRYLVNLPLLSQLWLHDNPCANVNHYREIVIKTLPNLIKLDNIDVTPQQREEAQNIPFTLKNSQIYNDQDSYMTASKNSPNKGSDKKRPSTGYKDNQSRQQGSRQQQRNLPSREIASKQKYRQQEYERQEYNNDEEEYIRHHNRQQPPSFQKQLPNFPQKQPTFPRAVQRKQPLGVNRYLGQETGNNGPSQRNKHILLAVITLLKQLDEQSLQIVGAQVNKLLR